ncbi:MAG: lipoyl synthase [Deltaproteobacteria bacterium]|nr:lipoyl synthase [Deltaproteobacteria bacterium]
MGLKKPSWLRRSIPSGPEYERVCSLLINSRLNTVCREAKCPNIGECFSQRIATFMIMGARCTRNCRFCGVEHGIPAPPDPDEPARVAGAVFKLGLLYVTVTSVTRDDLPDGGAGLFAEVIAQIRQLNRKVSVEVLIPDFQGDLDALEKVVSARPDVLNHNIETVPRLYFEARPQADYGRSLDLLARAQGLDQNVRTKSGLMLGLGEREDEIQQVLTDLLRTGCHILTLGQYLQPSRAHLPVARFVRPDEFDLWREKALEMGFSKVASGPFVRSSYHARELADN